MIPDQKCRPPRSLAPSRARLAPMAVAILILLAGACATEPRPAQVGTRGAQEPIHSASVDAPQPSIPEDVTYPNLGRFTDSLDQFAYKSAYLDCRTIGLGAAADAYGGDPTDPASVARAYATVTFTQATAHQTAALQGCLDGITAAATSGG